MLKRNIIVPKTARYFVIGQPGENIATVWFVCHGYGQPADLFIKSFSALENKNTLIIAPEGLHRFYWEKFSGRVVASWMTKEDREDDINDYVNYLDKVYEEVMRPFQGKSVKVIGLGFSQGTSTICRWIANKRSTVNSLILWAGSLPQDMEFSKEVFGHLKIHYVAGDKDPFIGETQLKQVKEYLAKEQKDFEIIQFDGKHEIDEVTLLALVKRI